MIDFQAYRLLRRNIGPVPLRDMALIAAITSSNAIEYEASYAETIEFAQQTPGVTLSGGRYSRAPESVYITDEPQ